MRSILAILLASVVVVSGAWWIGHLVGGLTLHLGDLTIEAPLPVVVLAQALLIAVIYAAIRIIATVFGLPGAFRSGGDRSRRRRGDDAVTATLVALAAQDATAATKAATRAQKLLGATPQTLLLTAYASGIAGRSADEEHAFEALSKRRDSAFLGLRGLLRIAASRGDFARAAELGRAAHDAYPNASWLRAERTDFAVRTGAWADALALARDDHARAVFATAAAAAETHPESARKLARDAFKRAPHLPAAGLVYAKLLRAQGREKAAQDVLRRAWGASPHPDIADLALQTAPAEPLPRLKAATELVREAKRHGESFLLLARLSLEAGLTGEAQRLGQAARAAGIAERRMFVLFADIAEATNNTAAHHEALGHAAAADPDPVWQCTNCSTIAESWRAACAHCHSVGTVKWTASPKPLSAATDHDAAHAA